MKTELPDVVCFGRETCSDFAQAQAWSLACVLEAWVKKLEYTRRSMVQGK